MRIKLLESTPRTIYKNRQLWKKIATRSNSTEKYFNLSKPHIFSHLSLSRELLAMKFTRKIVFTVQYIYT